MKLNEWVAFFWFVGGYGRRPSTAHQFPSINFTIAFSSCCLLHQLSFFTAGEGNPQSALFERINNWRNEGRDWFVEELEWKLITNYAAIQKDLSFWWRGQLFHSSNQSFLHSKKEEMFSFDSWNEMEWIKRYYNSKLVREDL